jgi:predicted nucleic acid-binding protein
MEYVLADTGVWYAMFDRRDPYWGRTEEKEELLDQFALVIPWPILYETLRTRMVNNRQALQRFQEYLKRSRAVFLDDSLYREEALDLAFSSALRCFRPLSLVDCTIRLMLEDTNVRINYLATFNERDFADVCHKRHIEMF